MMTVCANEASPLKPMFVEHLRAVVEHRVDADQLLEQRTAGCRRRAPGRRRRTACRLVSFSEASISARTILASSSLASLVRTSRAFSFLALEHEAARRFRNEEQQQHEQAGRNRAAGQHPAPAVVVHPVRVTVAAKLLDEVVHEVRHRDAADDRDLLVGDQRAALGGRRDLGDVHGREHRGEADAHAAEEAMADEVGDARRRT